MSAFLDDAIFVSEEKSAVESVQNRLLKEVGSRHEVDDGGTLVQNQQHGREDSERAIDEDEEGELRYVGEDEHARHDTGRKEQVGPDARQKGLPQRAVSREVDNALDRIQIGLALGSIGDEDSRLVVVFRSVAP